MLGQGPWLRKGIVAKELYNGGYGSNWWFSVTFFPVQDGPGINTKLLSNFFLGESYFESPPSDMFSQGRWLKIIWFLNQ